MKIFFNGWFSGFNDRTNPGMHIGFFLELFNRVYTTNCELGNLEESEILCEFDMLIGTRSYIDAKKWKHTYLFTGESTVKCNISRYTCVLMGRRNCDNIVNVPLFLPYIYCNDFLADLEQMPLRHDIPKMDVCVIISNPHGSVRSEFLNLLEEHFNVCYAGRYKNNIGGPLEPAYNTIEYHNFVSQFKFMICMENSRDDTYITEKLINGLLSKVVPVYWGSGRVHDYINQKRFIYLNDISDACHVIQYMKQVAGTENEWLKMVNSPIFPHNKLVRTIEHIADDIKCIVSNKCWNYVSSILCVCNPTFEPDRYHALKQLFNKYDIGEHHVKYISPTYKHTIDIQTYNENIKEQYVLSLRSNPIKTSELSLFLNYKSILEHIERNYSDGIFLILESDALAGSDILLFDNFMDSIKSKEWDLIHIGLYDERIWGSPNFTSSTGYKHRVYYDDVKIEDITNDSDDKYRLSRKFYTRCTDSFLWRYTAVVDFLRYMNDETNYGIPFDYYMCNFFEKHPKFKHYWSLAELFKQGSNLGIVKSEIQN